jgi:hypothetical protein
MKRLNLNHLMAAVGAGVLLGATARAQNPVSPPPKAESPPAATTTTNLIEAAEDSTRLPPAVLPVLVSPPPVPLTPTRYGGLVGQAIESGRPWQLLNPLAPPELGDGTQNLSVNPVTGRAEGVILFSFQLKPKPGAKKPPRRENGER